MRPVPASGSASAHHGRSDSLTPTATIPQMTYFVGTEDSISDLGEMSFQTPRFPYKNEYESNARAGKSCHRSNMSASTSISWPSPSLSSQPGGETPHDLSRPMTPVMLGTSGPESVISETSSPMSSPVASMSASRISSSLSLIGPHQGGIGLYQHANDGLAGSHTPQLIMPSLTVPRRRPFSDTGKTLGKLKVLVTGPDGIGKSTLITAIAQCSEHIVHVDPVTNHNKGQVSEVYASTRPYPWWRAELDPSVAPRRRSSAMDEMLDRNLCFVDCPPQQDSEAAHPAVRYVESQLFPLLHRPISDGDLWNLLSNGTEPIVDAVLYLLPHTGPEAADVEAIRLLQNTTNVIPLLARADEISNDDVIVSKQTIDYCLRDKNVEYFSFSAPGVSSESSDIYAVSSISDSDDDVMDASVLMNSEYVRPLVATDLHRLVEQLMSQDGSARLRHAASLKGVRWRRQKASSSSLQSALICRQPMSVYPLSTPSWNRSFLPEQYHRPLEMASWAESLRQSLEAERLCEVPMQLLGPGMTMNGMPLARVNQKPRRQKHKKSKREEVVPHHQDPLGLLGLAGQIKCNSRLTLELVSSIGVIGFFTSWLVRPDGMVSRC
ncbi:septin domain-containing protein [Trichoderma breve]|uniref:Septin domain-containing protein n=1 Tax=Trichoderma breve TaxID=2034170 RepID=A0A9W9E6P0_9HYPO|nr:septin domain-containing protein [Trichoderma breve]KAJ4860104.1 septin domain-containing protein [Trichoderma breve]